MNIQPIRIYGKDDIDNYRNQNAPNNGMININPLITPSSSSSFAQGAKEGRVEEGIVKNDDEVSLPEFEDTIDNIEETALAKCEDEEEEESSEEAKEPAKKRTNVFGDASEKKERKPFSKNSLVYLAMAISLLKFL